MLGGIHTSTDTPTQRFPFTPFHSQALIDGEMLGGKVDRISTESIARYFLSSFREGHSPSDPRGPTSCSPTPCDPWDPTPWVRWEPT